MRHLEGTPRNQTLLSPSVEDYIPEDHPVRVIDAFVDSLNLSEMGFQKTETARTGRWPYHHPGDLLKLYIYAYLNQTSSTRRLEKERHCNLEVQWLMKQLAPDFKTIAGFRKDNGSAIKKGRGSIQRWPAAHRVILPEAQEITVWRRWWKSSAATCWGGKGTSN